MNGWRLAYIYMVLFLTLIGGVLLIVSGERIGYFLIGADVLTLSVAIWSNWDRIAAAYLVLRSDEHYVLTRKEHGYCHFRKYMTDAHLQQLHNAFSELIQEEVDLKTANELIKK